MKDELAGYKDVNKRIRAACISAECSSDKIELVAVSKTFDALDVAQILEGGQRVFGENRVQEAAGKWPDLRTRYENIELHLIGPLQTNKVGDAVRLFDCIETLDRPKLAKMLSLEMEKQAKYLELFVQVNTGLEPQKTGVLPNALDDFLHYCREELALEIAGLMCIPPQHEVTADHFRLLAKLASKHDLRNLSMGMSADFELAIKCGATHIRVGSAIFGKR